MTTKRSLEVCFSPALLHLYETKGRVVVIIDIFRATSTITTALANGAEKIIPVASVEECIALGQSVPNSITAGERNGQVAPGLAYGNSPLEYPATFISGKTLNLTTTNGTRLLHQVKDADTIIIGSFLNLTAVCDYLLAQGKDVLLGCASWKDRPNMEDNLFAGAVVKKIGAHFEINCDSAHIALSMYDDALTKPSLLSYLQVGSHYDRLSKYGLIKDLEYCTMVDLHPVVPVLKENVLVLEK
ncbi:2-phosphosulfolactate phosphatase [Taibaiella sp. KBW10]|uniref:2-phosphosulfolactate phosphatase n=1 Tax=Taibaiella sp. KBW10 TaxID=2153357 RepID=UPI000F5A9C62|nr:2-phosphosulfolactate phosphatase [Taibaiella sp. KBW10]RQO30192.1 2-phosphosulfolactate phosphatase [Taibaiella sp. KBW10]